MSFFLVFYQILLSQVAIKRLDKSAVAMRRTASDARGVFKQEDPLIELTTMIYLSTPVSHKNVVRLIELLDDGKNLYEVGKITAMSYIYQSH